MKLEMRDGRVLQGTCVQIVQAMQSIAFDVGARSLSEYIDWVVQNAQRFEDATLVVVGASEGERAESLVLEMVRAGLARRVIG